MKKAVAYARFSSDNQRDESIDAQVRAIKYFAQNYGYDIIHVYADKALSGRTTNRPQFIQMIADSKSGEFDAVIVHKLDRFSRDSTDTLVYERELKYNNVELISVNERLDSSPEGLLMKSVIIGMNQFYSANLAREVMKGLKENACNCTHTGGKPPLGYDVGADKHLIINGQEAEAVRIIFNMYNDGYGYSAIIDELTSKGYKTKLDKPFGKNSLHEILKNEKYIGTFIYNKTASKNSRGQFNRHAYKEENEWIKIENGCPSIIEKELFKMVQRKMETNKKMTAKHKSKVEYLLSGLIYCGECKSLMTGETRRYRDHEYSYYVCNTAKRQRTCEKKPVHKKVIEQAVIEYANKHIFNNKNIDAICERIFLALQTSSQTDVIERVQSEINDLDKKIGNVTRAIISGTDIPELHEAVKQLSEQKQKATLKLYEMQVVEKADGLTLEQIKQKYKGVGDLNDLDEATLKGVLQSFIKRVYVYNNDNGGYRLKVIIAPFDSNNIFLDIEGGALSPPKIDFVSFHKVYFLYNFAERI